MSDPLQKLLLELTDEQVETCPHEELKKVYRLLRDHHVKETTALYKKLKIAREAYMELLER